MNKLFNTKFEDETKLKEYIFNAINEYTKNTGNSIDSLIVIDYIVLLKKYIDTYSKNSNKYLTLINMIKDSIDINNSGIVETDMVFTNLMTDEPGNYLSTNYLLIKNRLDNVVIFDILLFLKSLLP